MVIPLFFSLLVLVYAQPLVVDLGYASYEGRSSSHGISQRLGMRFAAAPVGEMRFAAPQDPLVLAGVQQASQVRWVPSCQCYLLIDLHHFVLAWSSLYSSGQ